MSAHSAKYRVSLAGLLKQLAVSRLNSYTETLPRLPQALRVTLCGTSLLLASERITELCRWGDFRGTHLRADRVNQVVQPLPTALRGKLRTLGTHLGTLEQVRRVDPH